MPDNAIFESYAVDGETSNALAEASDLPTQMATSGRPTLTYRGRRLHSHVDPDQEAATLIEEWRKGGLSEGQDGAPGVTCIVFGPGLGYVLPPLEREIQKGNRVIQSFICVEVDAEIARAALRLQVWKSMQSTVKWLVGKDSERLRRVISGYKDTITVGVTAGYRHEKEIYDRLLAADAETAKAERPMRILVPTPLYGGSLPTAYHCAAAFRKLGHQVEEVDFSPFYASFRGVEAITKNPNHRRTLQGLLTTYLAEIIVARALDWKADLVWGVAQTPLTPTALQELRAEGVHSAFWFVEDHQLFGYWRELAPHLDALFTIQRGDFHDQLRQLGVKHLCYLPCAANTDVHRPLELSSDEKKRYGSVTSFVGAGYANRQCVFESMNLPEFKIWGNDWPKHWSITPRVQEGGRRVSTEETARIYNATPVNINLHSSPRQGGVNPHGDFVNPRVFEIAACRAFQLVDARSELAELFDIGRELIVFRDARELPELVNHYLANVNERAAVAERAFQRVTREHTYVQRMTTALTFLEERLPRLGARRRGPNYVSSLKGAVGDDAEMIEFLSRFSDDDEVDLDQIIATIETGKRDLTRPEGIFLLMKEFRDWGRGKGVIT